MSDMKRREFITLLGGAAAAWPLAARAQQPERIRRVGVLMLYAENDREGQVRAAVFRKALENLGWTLGRNLQIDYHWGVGDSDWIRSAVAELLSLAPDVILANGGSAVRPAQQATRAIPIIFIGGADPVADGFVQSLAHPGGNLTGFAVLETSIGAKLLELLKETAPRVVRVAVLINPESPSSLRLFDSAATAAQKFGVEVVAAPVRESAEIEAAMTQIGREPDYGMIVPPDPSTNTHRKLIVELAAHYRLPTVYALRAATAQGGLMSYGVDIPDLFRQAAGYVDRVLRGEKPADLPVQQPIKFELVINLKTAKALGLTVPLTLQASADEVIE
jgi:putative tryptophan/tyrosine transport system substrate-binding protein